MRIVSSQTEQKAIEDFFEKQTWSFVEISLFD